MSSTSEATRAYILTVARGLPRGADIDGEICKATKDRDVVYTRALLEFAYKTIGETHVGMAINSGNIEALELMLSVAPSTASMRSELVRAARNRRTDMVELLLRHAASNASASCVAQDAHYAWDAVSGKPGCEAAVKLLRQAMRQA